MPGWQGKLSDNDLDILTDFILDPASAPEESTTLYEQNCTGCHFDRIPSGEDYDLTYNIIATGGSHEEMPVWGDLLTEEQLDALVAYTIETAKGTSAETGRDLYIQNCASCHGVFGEGGINPALSGDIIAPISTDEYLKTRDNLTLKAIISQGQPNFGMSPFSISYGGPLDNSDIDLLVTYIRSWEEDPPVELPPEVQFSAVALNGAEIYQGVCAQCHGLDATGGVGSSLRDSSFQSQNTHETIFDSISTGHMATSMIAWGEILSSEQIVELVDFILSLPIGEVNGGFSYAVMVNPIFETSCQVCHNDSQPLGGWNSVGYDNVMNTGDNAPMIIPGDVDTSVLAQLILGTHEDGTIMPPLGLMDEDTVQIILDWIAAGAPDN